MTLPSLALSRLLVADFAVDRSTWAAPECLVRYWDTSPHTEATFIGCATNAWNYSKILTFDLLQSNPSILLRSCLSLRPSVSCAPKSSSWRLILPVPLRRLRLGRFRKLRSLASLTTVCLDPKHRARMSYASQRTRSRRNSGFTCHESGLTWQTSQFWGW